MVAPMRFVVAALAGFALAVVPALAADHSVKTSGLSFAPKTITIAPGDKVIWSNPDAGNHNVKFDDGGLEKTASPSPVWNEEVSRTFPTAGSYRYVCEQHEADGMTGTVVVQAPATTGTTTSTTPTTTTPAPTATPTPTPAPDGTTPAAEDPVTVKLVGTRFTRRTGVRLRVSSDRARTITGTLKRSGRTFGAVRFKVTAGTQTVRVTRTTRRRALARGSYALTLRSSGARGLPVTVRFRVR